MAVDLLTPSRYGAPGTLNFDTRQRGRAVPAFKQFRLSNTDRNHYYIRAIETKAPASTGGQPRQYAGVGRSVFRLDSGTITDDLTNFQSTFDEFNDVVQGMVICNGPPHDDPTNTTESSFTPILLVTFGTGNPNPGATTATGTYYRVLNADGSTPWTASTATDTSKLTAWQIIKAGPDLYAACDAGRAAALGDWRVSKCPAGNNPTLAASWGNGLEVGSPEWIINGGAAIGDSPVWGKPDGLYYYDTQTRRYENVMKHLELVPHALNGKVTEAVQNGVIYTTHDGRAYFFDGVSVSEVSPHKFWPLLSRDIGNSRIAAVADAGEFIAMYTELAYQSTQNAGLVINKVTAAGAATAMTTNLVDGSLDTGSGTTLDSLPSGSFIDVWADIPFEGVIFHVTRSPNSTVPTVFDQVLYTSATDTFTAASGFIDGTKLIGNLTTNTSGGSLSYVAFPPSASSGVVMATDINFGALMQKVSFNYTTGTDITSKYGMRIRTSGILDSDTEIDEVEIIPYRAGMPNGGIYSTDTNFTMRDRAGLIGHVYLIKRERTTGFVPHDVYAVDSLPGVWAMAWHTGRLGQASGGQNLGQSLVLWGRYRTVAISEGPTRDPVRTRYPLLADVSTTAPGPLIQIAHDWKGKPDEWDSLKQLDRLKINTWFVQPTDKTEVFAQFDNRDIVTLGVFEGGPIEVEVKQGPFRSLNLWLGFDDFASTDETAPQFLEPYIIEYTLTDEFPAQDPASATPALT